MEHFGTGTGIYIQNGTGVQSFFTVPRDEAKLREGRFWKAEKCFWTQGVIKEQNYSIDCFSCVSFTIASTTFE